MTTVEKILLLLDFLLFLSLSKISSIIYEYSCTQ